MSLRGMSEEQRAGLLRWGTTTDRTVCSVAIRPEQVGHRDVCGRPAVWEVEVEDAETGVIYPNGGFEPAESGGRLCQAHAEQMSREPRVVYRARRIQHEEPAAVWVESDRTPTGAYRATIHPTPDVSISIPLDYRRATAYALAVVTACEYADYDAAVIAQMRAAGLGLTDAAGYVAALREMRRPVADSDTTPLTYVPIVSQHDWRPYVHVYLHDEPLTQWTPDEARGHAMHVLSAVVAAHLDQRYYWHLIRTGATPEQAAMTVHDLRRHRAGGDGA